MSFFLKVLKALALPSLLQKESGKGVKIPQEKIFS